MTTMKKTFDYLIFGLVALTSCNNSRQLKTEVSAAIADSLLIATAKKVDSVDSINYKASYFPSDSLYAGKILTPGIFHGDEVWETVEKEIWFGVFKDVTSDYVSKVNVKTSRVYDVVLDEDSLKDKTGWNVSVLSKDTCLILISGLDFLADRKISKLNLPKYAFLPDKSIQFNYLGVDYKIFAEGIKTKFSDNSDDFAILNYRLFLTANRNKKVIKELLVSMPRYDGQTVAILFAGDIDGDGVLDLVIDTSNHYNASSPTLYLSRPADRQRLLKVVGRHTSLGC